MYLRWPWSWVFRYLTRSFRYVWGLNGKVTVIFMVTVTLPNKNIDCTFLWHLNKAEFWLYSAQKIKHYKRFLNFLCKNEANVALSFLFLVIDKIESFQAKHCILTTVEGPNFVPCPYRTVPTRTAAFFVFRTVINFLKSVYRTVPRSIQNVKSANWTVKNAFVFPFKKRKPVRFSLRKSIFSSVKSR